MIFFPLPKGWRSKIRVSRGQIVLLVALAAAYGAAWWYVRENHSDLLSASEKAAGESRAAIIELLRVKFRVPDPEVMVFPPTLEAPVPADRGYFKVHEFSLCINLGDFSVRGELEERRRCLDVGRGAGQWGILSLRAAEREGDAPATEEARRAILARILKIHVREGSGGRYVDDPDLAAVAGLELRAAVPSGFPPTAAKKAYLWQGSSKDDVATLINCRGVLPEEKALTFRLCEHEFLVAPEVSDGRSIVATLRYDIDALPRWKELESRSQELLQTLKDAAKEQ